MFKPRGILIAGNWKMNLNRKETEAYFSDLKNQSGSFLNSEALKLLKSRSLRASLIPPYFSLEKAREKLAGLPFPLYLIAQNAHWEKKGAFTGEISGPMLSEIGIHSVLIGHSERRQFFGETNETVRKRAESLLEQGFHVILCIGETRAERDAGRTAEVLTRQLSEGLPGSVGRGAASFTFADKLTLAYEPVWAIGTGLTASPEQAEEAHRVVRGVLKERLGAEIADRMPILYGGSVTPENAQAVLSCENVDGALVGGASLKAESYLALLRAGAGVLGS